MGTQRMNDMTINTKKGFQECIETINLQVLPGIQKKIEKLKIELKEEELNLANLEEESEQAAVICAEAFENYNKSLGFFQKLFGKSVSTFDYEPGKPECLRNVYAKRQNTFDEHFTETINVKNTRNRIYRFEERLETYKKLSSMFEMCLRNDGGSVTLTKEQVADFYAYTSKQADSPYR